MDSFSYQPLNLSKKEIRLLILSPSTEDDPLSGRIIHSNILSGLEQLDHTDSHTPGYEALSYEWGTPQNTFQCIILDGKEFRLRWNLYRALRRLRLSEKLRVLWVDAICIDQGNNRERNHQVNLMKMIYVRADKVIVWLGDKLHGPNPLLRMRDFSNYVLPTSWLKEDVKRAWADASGSNDLEFKYLSIWSRLPELSYWSRLWIIQEFVLAKFLVLYLDEAVIDLEDFEKFCNKIDRLLTDPQARLWLIKFSNTVPLRLHRNRVAIGPGKEALVPLLDLVRTYESSKCEDIRDRVFGLHSLALQCCRDSTPVDYSASLYSICQSLVSHYLLKHYGAIEHATGNLDRSTCLGICKSIQRALEISAADCLTNISLGGDLASIRVTGSTMGVVCFDASDIFPAIFAYKPSDMAWIVENSINGMYKTRKTYALTRKLVDQIWHISITKGWHYCGIFRDRIYIPPLTFHDKPQLLRVPETPNITEILQFEHQSLESLGLQWDQRVTDRNEIERRYEVDLPPLSETRGELSRGLFHEPIDEPIESLQSNSIPFEFLSLEACISTLLLSTPGRCRPFFCSSGMIGYTYGDVKEGDIICAFRGIPVVIALRYINSNYEVSGIGWDSFNNIGPIEWKVASDGSIENRNPRDFGRLCDDRIIKHPVDFLFSIQDLMLLSAYRSD